MADSADDTDTEPALAKLISALAQGELPIAGRSHAVVVGGGRQGTGAEVKPAQVIRSPRSAMLVQPQERLLSQHLQARFAGGVFGCWWRFWFAGGGRGSLAIDDDAHHRYR